MNKLNLGVLIFFSLCFTASAFEGMSCAGKSRHKLIFRESQKIGTKTSINVSYTINSRFGKKWIDDIGSITKVTEEFTSIFLVSGKVLKLWTPHDTSDPHSLEMIILSNSGDVFKEDYNCVYED